MEFLRIPSGSYRIGSDRDDITRAVGFWRSRLLEDFTWDQFESWLKKEWPAFQCRVETFEMSRTLVTNEQYRSFIEATGRTPVESQTVSWATDRHPAWGMTLEEARAFCDWLSDFDADFFYRLPREVEWEVAARGPQSLEFPYGNDFDKDKANTIESGIDQTTPVDAYAHAPGPFGHLDLAGNVEEWVNDPYWVYPGGELVKDDLFEVFGMDYFILRGGSFRRGGDLSRGARRHGAYPKPDYRFTGFRVVRERKNSPPQRLWCNYQGKMAP